MTTYQPLKNDSILWYLENHGHCACPLYDLFFFASMSAADDAKKESVGVELLGRWSDVDTASGHLICRAESYEAVVSWLYQWLLVS